MCKSLTKYFWSAVGLLIVCSLGVIRLCLNGFWMSLVFCVVNLLLKLLMGVVLVVGVYCGC